MLLDGFNPANPPSPYLRTDAGGRFRLALPLPTILNATTPYFAFAHLRATSPDGWWISQVHEVDVDTVPNLGAANTGLPGLPTLLPLSDDDFLYAPIGFTFPFYGTSYTGMYVGSNGFVTFGPRGGQSSDWSTVNFSQGPNAVPGYWTWCEDFALENPFDLQGRKVHVSQHWTTGVPINQS